MKTKISKRENNNMGWVNLGKVLICLSVVLLGLATLVGFAYVEDFELKRGENPDNKKKYGWLTNIKIWVDRHIFKNAKWTTKPFIYTKLMVWFGILLGIIGTVLV